MLNLFVVCLPTSCDFVSPAKQFRTVFTDSPVCFESSGKVVTTCPLFTLMPCQFSAVEAAFSNRWRNSLTMFVSSYHSHLRNARLNLIQPSSVIVFRLIKSPLSSRTASLVKH